MQTHIYPIDMTDRQWQGIKDLIPPAKTGGRAHIQALRQVIIAMLYPVMSGC